MRCDQAKFLLDWNVTLKEEGTSIVKFTKEELCVAFEANMTFQEEPHPKLECS